MIFSRRIALKVGALAGFNLSLADYLQADVKKAKAKSIVHIFLPGGIAHQETFDPKPLSPLEYRGPYSAIDTNVAGLQLSENLSNISKIADKITICRSLTHGEAAHERGTHNIFTGYRPSLALKYPSVGSVVSNQLQANVMPSYICIPQTPNEYAGSGFLSPAYGPFSVGSDPANKNFKVQDLSLPNGMTEKHFEKRKEMLYAVDKHFNELEESQQLDAMNSFYKKAYSLISSPEARHAFDIFSEDEKVLDDYGRNQAGMRMLLARRLIEAGTKFVSLTYGSWDHHTNIKTALVPQINTFDKAFSTFILDLEQRGLLDSTLLVVNSEFGRTPKINKDAGRDHWPKVFSCVLAGGGIKRGYVYGSSDNTASEPEDKPLSVADLTATIFNQIGIDPHGKLIASGNRPIEITENGKVIDDILG